MARLKSPQAPFEDHAEAPASYRLDGGAAATQASAALPYLLEDYAGLENWRDKPIFSQEQVIAQLDAGSEIDGQTITFGFLDGPHTVGLYNNPGDGHSEPAGYSPLSEAQREATRELMVLWDDLIAPSMVEKYGNGADIMLANTVTTGPAAAWAYYPGEGHGHKILSDIWVVDPNTLPGNNALGLGGAGSYTLVHEIGHSLGLSHPGAYDAAADDDGDGVPDPIGYASDAEYAQDSRQYTVMSYFEDDETGGGETWNSALPAMYSPQTPLLHDILAIQQKYGVDPTTRADDTVYFANSTAGNAVYDLAQNPFPYLSVYDAGGNDTFDFSTANMGVFIDLRAGSFSSASRGYLSLDEANAARAAANSQAGPWDAAGYEGWLGFVLTRAQGIVAADTGVAGVTATMPRNISIAYNTVIENAIGGQARDYLVGNDVANVLRGNGGDDVLNGLGGDDQLAGGAGADVFRFTELGGSDAILDFTSGTDTIDLSGIDADTGAAGDQAFGFVGGAAFSGTAGELRSYSSGGAGFLAGDVDGDAVADFTIGIGSSPIVQADLVF
jgi:serralysin